MIIDIGLLLKVVPPLVRRAAFVLNSMTVRNYSGCLYLWSFVLSLLVQITRNAFLAPPLLARRAELLLRHRELQPRLVA